MTGAFFPRRLAELRAFIPVTERSSSLTHMAQRPGEVERTGMDAVLGDGQACAEAMLQLRTPKNLARERQLALLDQQHVEQDRRRSLTK